MMTGRSGLSVRANVPEDGLRSAVSAGAVMRTNQCLTRHILFLNVVRSFWQRVGSDENSWSVKGVFMNSL